MTNAFRVFNIEKRKWYIMVARSPEDRTAWLTAFGKEAAKTAENVENGMNLVEMASTEIGALHGMKGTRHCATTRCVLHCPCNYHQHHVAVAVQCSRVRVSSVAGCAPCSPTVRTWCTHAPQRDGPSPKGPHVLDFVPVGGLLMRVLGDCLRHPDWETDFVQRIML